MGTADWKQAEIDVALAAALETERRNLPCHVNRISSMGHPCERYLYHSRVDWDKKISASTDLLGIFKQGNLLEMPLVQWFNTQVGARMEPMMRIIGQHTTTRDKLFDEYNISGTIDGFLQVWTGFGWDTVAVCDIKTAGQHPYAAYSDVNSLERFSWSRKYKAQIMLYSFAHDLEDCVLFFCDKSNIFAHWKMMAFPLDMAYIESLLQKAQRINTAIANRRPPDKLNRPDECEGCDFCYICMPDLQPGKETKVVTDPEILTAMSDYLAYEPFQKDFKAAEKSLFSMLVKGQNVVVGDTLITWKQSSNGTWRKKIESRS